MSEPPPAAPAERNTSYRVPAARTGAELREKGSRFLAVVGPVAGDEEAGAVRAGLSRLSRPRPCRPRRACIDCGRSLGVPSPRRKERFYDE
jgi:hypothetical protein